MVFSNTPKQFGVFFYIWEFFLMSKSYIRACVACEAIPKKRESSIKISPIVSISTKTVCPHPFPEFVKIEIELDVVCVASPISVAVQLNGQLFVSRQLYVPPFKSLLEQNGRVASVRATIRSIVSSGLVSSSSFLFEKLFETSSSSICEEKMILDHALVEKHSKTRKLYPYGGVWSEERKTWEQAHFALSVQKNKTEPVFAVTNPKSLSEEVESGAFSIFLTHQNTQQKYVTKGIQHSSSTSATIILQRKD